MERKLIARGKFCPIECRDNLIKMFRTDKKLLQDYCPMYDQGKSGYWISEIKGIHSKCRYSEKC
jgi:hypothetical protein